MAVLDLPEPLQSPPSSGIAGTDDLLAQMAGDEIDRLLAEADIEANPDASREVVDVPAGLSSVQTPPAPTQEPDLSSELDRVLDTIATPEPVAILSPPASPSQPASTTTADETNASAAATARTDAAHDDPETTSAERAALDLPHAPAPAALRGNSHSDLDVAAGSEELPFFLKPLEWFNAPLAACSESTLDAIGRVAILTLVNAIAVLAYVIFFRKH